MNHSTDLYLFVGLPRGNVSGLCHAFFELQYGFIIVMSINLFNAMILTLCINSHNITPDFHAKDKWKGSPRQYWLLYTDMTHYSSNQKPAYTCVILCVTDSDNCMLFIAMGSIHVHMIKFHWLFRFPSSSKQTLRIQLK